MSFTIDIKKPKLGRFMKSNMSEIARARELGATWKEISERLSEITGRKCNPVYVSRSFKQLQIEAAQQTKEGGDSHDAPVQDEVLVTESTSGSSLVTPSIPDATQGRPRFSSISPPPAIKTETHSRSQDELDREEYLRLSANYRQGKK